MGVEDNKALVLRYFESLGAGDTDACLDALADDVTYWYQGNLEINGTKVSGTKTKPELAAEFEGALAIFDRTLRVTPKGITAEGDRVALEGESYATLRNGKVYQNTYHFLFTVRGGKIASVKEYFDTLYARDILSPQLQA